MSVALRLLAVLALCVALVLGAMYYARIGLIFAFDQAEARPEDLPRTSIRRLPAFGADPALTVWVTEPNENQPVVIYFMGRSGSLALETLRLRGLVDAGFGIAAMAYRGGAGQAGTPGAEALHRDALRVYAGLDGLFGREIPAVDRVIYGHSLGAGPATRLAAEQEELAVILDAPITGLCAAKSGLLAIVPGCWLYAGQEFETLDRIGSIGAPLLILHGRQDRIVPVRRAERLFEAAATPKYLEIYEEGGHENLARIGAGEDAIAFVRTLRGVR